MATRTQEFIRSRRITAGAMAILLAAVPAFAITGGDVIDRMNKDERAAYLEGAIEMAMWTASADEKNNAKAECIEKWYFRNDATMRTIFATFEKYKDQPAIGLLRALINRACPAK
jgi:hypothetical protein